MAITISGSGIVEANLADNAVTLAKMAGGTDGQIITYDASGDPAAVGPGTDGQVLTSTGSTTPPAFEAAAAAGISDLSPYWHIYDETNISVSDYVTTKMTFASGEIDSDSAFASSRFTVPSGEAGKYYIYIVTHTGGTGGNYQRHNFVNIYVNGSNHAPAQTSGPGHTVYVAQTNTTNIQTIDLSVGDYVEAYGAIDWQGSSGSIGPRVFGGFKIG